MERKMKTYNVVRDSFGDSNKTEVLFTVTAQCKSEAILLAIPILQKNYPPRAGIAEYIRVEEVK